MDETTKRLIEAIGQLVREAARLRGDVVRLREQFEPVNEPAWTPEMPVFAHVRTAERALEIVDMARDNIRGSEYHLNAIRALLSEMDADDIREWKEKMKRALTPHPPEDSR